MDQRDRDLAGAQREHRQPRDREPAPVAERDQRGQPDGGGGGRQDDRAAVGGVAGALEPASEPQAHRAAHPGDALELAPAAIDQEPADVRGAAGAGGGERQRRARDLDLGQGAAPGDVLDDVAVAVAGGEVHRRVGPGRIAAQRALDDAHRLDEDPPVGGDQEAQAADAVADRDLIGGLGLAGLLEDLLDGLALFGQALLEPRRRERERGAVTAEAAGQLGQERIGQRRRVLDHVGQDQHDLRRIAEPDLGHPLDPAGGALAVAAAGGDRGHHPPQVLEQRQTQHDRDRPQLAEAQRRDDLVRADERAQPVAVDPPVGVRDQLEREVVDPGRVGAGGVGEPRQLAAVGARQVQARGLDLLLDQRVVVDEPLGGRRDPAASGDRVGDQRVGVGERGLVLAEPRQQPVGAAAARDVELVPARHLRRVAGELIDAEQLGPDRRARARRVARPVDRGLARRRPWLAVSSPPAPPPARSRTIAIHLR
ncbi:MAG: hypothetical protein IPL61_10130 [Myxococcales bacterium]|nr:hypothetical protein [Myxococcales bacterium]